MVRFHCFTDAGGVVMTIASIEIKSKGNGYERSPCLQ
jgi:hypothetical protein